MILFNISGCRRKNSWFSRKIYFQTLFIFRYTPTAPISRDEKCRDFLFSGGDFLFSADDLLEIEIYYNKKKFSGAALIYFWILAQKCRDFVFSAGDFFFSADDFLEIAFS